MKFTEAEIKGVWIIEPERHGDSRGWFMETFRLADFRAATGLTGLEFVQDNESMSVRGVLRGLHFQRGDLRAGSPTYGRHVAVELSDITGRQMFIPRGFAHGFLVLSPEARFEYKVDNYYSPGEEGSVRWDDPDLAIAWPLDGIEPCLSEKDRNAPLFKELQK